MRTSRRLEALLAGEIASIINRYIAAFTHHFAIISMTSHQYCSSYPKYVFQINPKANGISTQCHDADKS